MNYYQHHIGDFIRDTARLPDSQCMAYLRMIWMYYETEQPFEDDIDALAFKLGANANDVHQILKHFFFEHDGKWHNARCDKEILAFRERSKKAKASASARWDNARSMRTHSERNTNARPSASKKTETNDADSMRTYVQDMRTQSERNPNAMVFDANQEPVLTTNTSSLRSEVTREEIPKPVKKPAVAKPDDVAEQTWQDWQQLRKAKRAPVTETVLQKARQEAGKAGIALDDFLQVWCARGSQGLEAAWLTPAERRRGPPQENFSAVDYGSGIHDL